MNQLYFVRHGESEFNARGIFAGQTDTPLTDHGREQAREAGTGAHAIGIDLIVSSPLSRTVETAQIIASIIGYDTNQIILHSDLKERALGPLEGQPFITIDDKADYPGIETVEHLNERVQTVLDYLAAQPAQAILVVGHGSFSKALRHALDPSSHPEELPNAVIVQLI